MLIGRYEPAVVFEALQLSGTRQIVYDVGANIGYITLTLARNMKDGGKIFAFEPAPGNVEMLRKLTKINDLEARVEVLPLALGNRTGKQRFIMWHSSEMYLLASAIDGQDAGCCPSTVVDGTTLDSFVFEQKNPPPQLIKIDVEGAEALVLEGAERTLATYSPHLIIEIHGPMNAQKVWEILDSLGYGWAKITEQGRLGVTTKGELLSYFTKDAWTHHFLLIRE
jgi:FkbM family methyltransferase